MAPTDEGPKRSGGLDLPAAAQEAVQEGTIAAVLPNSMFRVRLPDRAEVVAHVAGKLRLLPVRLLPGDHVLIQVSRYDPSRGRILGRR